MNTIQFNGTALGINRLREESATIACTLSDKTDYLEQRIGWLEEAINSLRSDLDALIVSSNQNADLEIFEQNEAIKVPPEFKNNMFITEQLRLILFN